MILNGYVVHMSILHVYVWIRLSWPSFDSKSSSCQCFFKQDHLYFTSYGHIMLGGWNTVYY
jgi:hypothetical protein